MVGTVVLATGEAGTMHLVAHLISVNDKIGGTFV